MTKTRILVIDDDPAMLSLMKFQLQRRAMKSPPSKPVKRDCNCLASRISTWP